MGLLDQIEKLQKKPRETREKILAISVLIIMFLIVAVWTQTTRFGLSKDPAEVPSESESPFKALWNIASDGFKNVLEQF